MLSALPFILTALFTAWVFLKLSDFVSEMLERTRDSRDV